MLMVCHPRISMVLGPSGAGLAELGTMLLPAAGWQAGQARWQPKNIWRINRNGVRRVRV